jgi:hypothetical protein
VRFEAALRGALIALHKPLKVKAEGEEDEKEEAKEMSPSELNTVFRLALVAKNHGAHFLDDADSFDSMIGRGRFAELNSDTIGHVRRLVKPSPPGTILARGSIFGESRFQLLLERCFVRERKNCFAGLLRSRQLA